MNKSKVIVVTGASAGVGRATVRAFARQGACLGLLARGPDGLEAARSEVEDLGGKALVVPVDVADPDEVEGPRRRLKERLAPSTYGSTTRWFRSSPQRLR